MTGENGFRPHYAERVYDGSRFPRSVNGYISEIDYEDKVIVVHYDDGDVNYDWDDFYNTWSTQLGGYWEVNV